MITADLTAALAPLISGDTTVRWQRPPGGAVGSYATTLPFQLARPPERLATRLAAALAKLPWVRAAVATDGYLTVTVTTGCLAALPGRINSVAPGHCSAVPPLPDLATASTWAQAWRVHRAALVGRCGDAVARAIMYKDFEIDQPPSSVGTPDSSPVSVALGYYGADAVRFALARAGAPEPAAIARQLELALDVANPFVLVRHAHADAASTLRWASDLAVAREPFGRRTSAHPAELALVDQLSWLPERLAAAHRTNRPGEVTAYLEQLASAWLDCAQQCPALPFRGGLTGHLGDRLDLAQAASRTLAAGLGLLGVTAPARI